MLKDRVTVLWNRKIRWSLKSSERTNESTFGEKEVSKWIRFRDVAGPPGQSVTSCLSKNNILEGTGPVLSSGHLF